MNVLVVTFHLDGVSEAEYYRVCDQEAPVFRDIPGLLGKTWLSSPETNTFGGVYRFRDREALDAYLASDVFRDLQDAPVFRDVRAEAFSVLVGPSSVTRGWELQTA